MAETTGYAAAKESNDLLMSYAREVVWGTKPAVQFKQIRLDGEGFKSSKTRVRPKEINSTGQASASITTKEESTGSLNFSVSAGTHNDIMESAMGAAFSADLNITGTTISAAASDNSFNGVGKFNNVVVGQWVKVSGFTGVANSPCNGFFQVMTKTNDKITVKPTGVIVDDAAGEAIAIHGSMLRNGKEFYSHYFQKCLQAESAPAASDGLFLDYPGAFCTGGTYEVGVSDYLKGTFAFLNKDELPLTIEAGTSAPSAPPSGTVIDSVKGIKNVLRNDALVAAIVQKIGLEFTKEGARTQLGIGSASAQGLGKGTFTAKGKLSTYFKDFLLFTEFKNEVGGPISWRALDNTGKGYIFTYCNANIMNPSIVSGGPDTDIMADFDIEANPGDATLYGGKTIQVDYFAA